MTVMTSTGRYQRPQAPHTIKHYELVSTVAGSVIIVLAAGVLCIGAAYTNLLSGWGFGSLLTSLVALGLVAPTLLSPARSESDSYRTMRHLPFAKWVVVDMRARREVKADELYAETLDFNYVVHWRTLRTTYAALGLLASAIAIAMLGFGAM